MRKPESCCIQPPGGRALRLRTLICDFSGTLARDGMMRPGVASRLRRLGRQGRVVVLTADTFGACAASLRNLLVEWQVIKRGPDKARCARQLALAPYAVIGNGRNDVDVMSRAALGIAVLGPEGCSAELLHKADVVVRDVRDALDLFLHPRRLMATLRR